MRASTAIRPASHLWLCALVISLFALSFAAAQPIQFGFGPPAQAELTAPHLDVISGTASTRLEQARALAIAGNWDEAVDTFRELAADDTSKAIALDKDRYVSLRTYCHLQIARLPAEGLAAYRRQVDERAEGMYRDGLAARDEGLLQKLVDEMYCSSWGDDALLALGELALERADFAAARRYWEQINPMLRDPSGMPAWLALRDIDLDGHWPDIQRRWNERTKPPDWLTYPDTNLDLVDIRARLILASIRAGQFDRAKLELEVFRRLHSEADGMFGGQRQSYVAALDRLLSSARDWPAVRPSNDWPTFAGFQSRSPTTASLGPDLTPAWANPITISIPEPARFRSAAQWAQNEGGRVDKREAEKQPQTVVRESERPSSCYPVVTGGVVTFADANGIHAADLMTGKPAITRDGLLYHNEAPARRQAREQMEEFAGVAHGVPRLTLNIVNGIVYSRAGTPATARLNVGQGPSLDRLVGVDLRREGLLVFRSEPESASWSFDGAPVCDGERLYIAMRHSDVTPHAFVACFDAASRAQLWRTPIGSADTPAGGVGDEITHNLLTLVEDRIYFNSNVGFVAALDIINGQIRWLHRYARLDVKFSPGSSGPPCFDRDPSPCLYHDGIIVIAPSDSPAVFALDADTGKTIWQNANLPDALHLLGVAGENLVVCGNRLASLDIGSGKVKWTWPESEQAGIRGMGCGLVAGNEIFWPTRHEIYAIDATTGARTRPPIDIRAVSDCGANLAVSRGRLIVAGHEKIMAYGPPSHRARDSEEKSVASVPFRSSRLRDQTVASQN
jgi:cellulose synthase operon protein C